MHVILLVLVDTPLETFIFHEIRAQIAYSQCEGELSYFRTASDKEADFVWRREYTRPTAELGDSSLLSHCYGVYLGEHAQQEGRVRILPLVEFLSELNGGKVLAA